MAKQGTTKDKANKQVKNILITLPKPLGNRSPYFDIAEKYGVNIDFHPFIEVQGLEAKEFRQQKINIPDYSAVIFVSRNAVDHFFRICDEMKIKVSQDMKYFCASEAVALYLQKFILYRRRKVFFSADGSSDGLIEVLKKHKTKEKFIFPLSEATKNDISPILKEDGFDFQEAALYRTINPDISQAMAKNPDMIVLFSPFSIDAFYQFDKNFEQGDIQFGAFGPATCKAMEEKGLELCIRAPQENVPSMSSALILFLEENQS